MKRIPLSILAVFTLASILWLPNLFTKGMFMDGVYDALFAHNLLHGVGSFWSPQTADYMHPNYWDNPQLSSYFLSLWYKVFGDFYWVEKLYSLFCAFIQLALLASLWKICFSENERVKKYFWLPCLLFLILPLTSWCYSNNLMENTMSIFTTSSVIVFLLFLRANKNLFLYAVTGGTLIFLALLTKGPVALFPLTVPFFFIWVEENLSWEKSFAYVLIQFIVTVILFAFVFSMDAPKNFLQHYIDVQLMPALNGKPKASASHFAIFQQLLITLSPLIVLSGVSFVTNKAKSENKSLFQIALAFIVVGLSASAPIALSAKQNKHYLLPSLPLFAVGFSCLILPLIRMAEEKFNNYFTQRNLITAKAVCMAIILFCFFCTAKNVGTYSRDKELLTDLEKIQLLVKSENVIRADWSLYSDWALRANLNRYYDKKICMPDEEAETNFYLTPANSRGDKLRSDAQKIFSGDKFDLYQIHQ